MAPPTRIDFQRLYREASAWPVRDRLALIQLLVGTVRLDLMPDEAGPGAEKRGAESETGHEPEAGDTPVPRGVPVARILARTVPVVSDLAGDDELRWQYLKEKYLR